MQQQAIDPRQAAGGIVDLRDGSRRTPLSRQGQLAMLEQQLRWCDDAVRTAQRETEYVMCHHDSEEADRWRAVRELRALVWKVSQEILPLVGRVPPALQAHPHYLEVLRAAHELRRSVEDALRDNANHTVDLAEAWDGDVSVTR